MIFSLCAVTVRHQVIFLQKLRYNFFNQELMVSFARGIMQVDNDKKTINSIVKLYQNEGQTQNSKPYQ